MTMIHINLLPVEARRAESTPLPRLLVTLAGTALTGMLFFSLLWLFLAAVPGQWSLKNAKEKLLRQQQALARQADALEAKLRAYRRRADQVKLIRTQRTLWAPQIDWFCDQVPEDVWLSGLTVKPPKKRTSKSKAKLAGEGPTVTIKAFCSGNDEARVASFLKAIQSHPNFQKYYLSPPQWTTITKTEEKTGGEVQGFTVMLVMKPRQMPATAKTKTRGAPTQGARNRSSNVARAGS